MSSCLFCGSAERNFSSKFCTECGSNWTIDQVVDKTSDVHRYVESLYQSVQSSNFDESTQAMIKKMRERFKISHATDQRIRDDLRSRLQIIEEMHRFSLEFNQNDSDAYAEQDTLLQFRLINNSDGEQLKSVELTWDDPDSASGRAFRAVTSMAVRPGSMASLQGSHVFMRFGPKSIDRMQLKVELPWGDVGKFIIEPMVFNVRNPDQKISKNITNNISMERGVLDNSSNLSDADGSGLTVGRQAVWRKVSLFPMVEKPERIEEFIVSPVREEPKNVDPPKTALQPVDVENTPVELTQIDSSNSVALTDQQNEFASSNASIPAELNKRVGGVTSRVVDPLQMTDVRSSAMQVLKCLSWFSDFATNIKPNSVVTSDRFDLEFLDEIFQLVPDSAEDAILGMVFQDGSTVKFDQNDYVTKFDCDAVIFSDFGITLVSVIDAEIQSEAIYNWGQITSQEWSFYARRFPGDKYVVSFGNELTGDVLVGCKFDLRQYQGSISVASVLEDANSCLSCLYEFAPKVDAVDDESSAVQLVDDLHETDQDDEIILDIEEEITNEDEDEDEDEDDRSRQAVLDQVSETIVRFFGRLNFALQHCDEGQLGCVFTKDKVSQDLLTKLYDAVFNSGSGVQVICVEPGCALIDDDSGVLVGWNGAASVLSNEGVFHMLAQSSGEFSLDGANSFLAWKRFFGELGGNLIVREDGPDLWLGTPMNYLIRGCYVDYSPQILQWDYFQNYVQKELQGYLQQFRDSVNLL